MPEENRLILGTLGIGSQPDQIAGYAPITDNDAFALMDAAWHLGLRTVDTALSYGSGTALRRIAEWQASRSHCFAVVAKVGRPVIDGEIRPDYTPDALLRELDVYLEHGLNVATVLIKDPPSDDITSGRWEAHLSRIMAEYPRVRTGFASHNLVASREAPMPSCKAVVEIEANAANWILSELALRHLASLGVETWAMQPLAGGFLTAQQSMQDRLHPADWRNVYPKDVLDRKHTFAARAARAFGQVMPGVSIAVAAHAFLLSQPLVQRVVIGPRHLDHFDDITHALQLVQTNTGSRT